RTGVEQRDSLRGSARDPKAKINRAGGPLVCHFGGRPARAAEVATHVEVPRRSFPDAGSTPAASTTLPAEMKGRNLRRGNCPRRLHGEVCTPGAWPTRLRSLNRSASFSALLA